jgi:hypothetical protein
MDNRKENKEKCAAALAATLLAGSVEAQQITREELVFLSSEWTGERFDGGRPRQADDILQRMQLVTHEEAWAVLRIAGFTAFFRSYHPSHHNPPGELNTTVVGSNQPTRIGAATVMPGDAVLGRAGGVIFCLAATTKQRSTRGIQTCAHSTDANWCKDLEPQLPH